MYKKIILKPTKEKSLLRQHLWVFSGAIAKSDSDIQNGEIVEVYSSKNDFLALGHYQNGSISVRILTFEKVEINYDFWLEKLKKAIDYRKTINLLPSEVSNVFRLVHGEGDYCPGLVIDIYNHSAVVQIHSVGMSNARFEIVAALQQFVELKLNNIFLRDEINNTVEQKLGNESETIVVENNFKFKVDLIKGQKTGFFIDQRENRNLLAKYCNNKSVLNLFSYTGGFSVYAAGSGALLVHTVDSSEPAIKIANSNIELNNVSANHCSYAVDAFDFLKDMKVDYDLIILDPPAFAKHIKSLSNAREAYIRLNRTAIKAIKSGGIIFTFSCSQVVSKEIFRNLIFTAAYQAGRTVRVLNQLTQPPDHPVNLFHPESEYLKGLVIYVE
ncbi:MAG: class I SAM-dependent rRNA methyltransferase [Bacteroidetes bacterium]|nr:class I SAM-dependent rRNA methyltransferase [Bacteroidota bacterium]